VKQRIQKVLAAAGVDSRRHVEQMVEQGRVSVNGVTKTRLPILVDPDEDQIRVDGDLVKTGGVLGREDAQGRKHKAGGLFYLMLNKPRGVYSTNYAQGAQTRAIDLLPANFPARVYPVGRLDADSRGLLLLTNDGELTNLLTHPKFGVPKTYRATIDGLVPPEHMQMLEKGLYLVDRESHKTVKTGRAVLKIHSRTRDKTILDITIKEGKNRQIRRMLSRLGHKVRDLNRIKFGPLEMERLPIGAVRTLLPDEVKELREAAERVKAFFEKSRSNSKKPGKSDRKRGKPLDESADFVPDDVIDDD
jgi:23S rRNA pseudouridine2605 synthase